MPRPWRHALQALQEFHLLFSRAWRIQSQDLEILYSPCSPSSAAAALQCGASFPSSQLLPTALTEQSRDQQLTWSFSGLSEMSFRLVEVRFL